MGCRVAVRATGIRAGSLLDLDGNRRRGGGEEEGDDGGDELGYVLSDHCCAVLREGWNSREPSCLVTGFAVGGLKFELRSWDADYEIIRITRRSSLLNAPSDKKRRPCVTEDYPKTEALFDAMLLTSAHSPSRGKHINPVQSRSLHLCVSASIHRVVHILFARHLRVTLPLNLTEGCHNTTSS